MHEDSKRESRVYYFFGFTLILIFFISLISGVLIIPFVLDGLMSVVWGIFFICYSFMLVIIDFVFFSNKYSKYEIIWYWKHWREDYWSIDKTRRRRDLLKKLEKGPIKKRKHEERIDKRMFLASLGFIEIIIFAAWMLSIGTKPVGPILIIVIMSFFVTISLLPPFKRRKARNVKKIEKMEKKRRELRKFQASHPEQ